jgi:hypothetical protein
LKKHAWWIGTLTALAFMTLLTVGPKGPADASSLSRGSAGWSAARWYLEERGSSIRTLATTIAEGIGESDVLVVTGPAAGGFAPPDADAVERFVRGGGRLVLGYSSRTRPSLLRDRLALAFKPSILRPRSLNPMIWKEEASRTDHLPLLGSGPRVALGPVKEYPLTQEGDEILVANARAEPLAILRPFGKGEILLLPDELFSNGRLKGPGNNALLEGIRRRFGEGAAWAFDEYHHGVASAGSPAGLRSRRGLDLFLFQILLAYGLFVAALGRRFGPEWPEPVPASGATGAFLMTTAGIHDRLGHHRDAAVVLRDRAREVLGVDVSLAEGPEFPGARGLIEVARRIHEKQKEGRLA